MVPDDACGGGRRQVVPKAVRVREQAGTTVATGARESSGKQKVAPHASATEPVVAGPRVAAPDSFASNFFRECLQMSSPSRIKHTLPSAPAA
jgi:hypothetical protein